MRKKRKYYCLENVHNYYMFKRCDIFFFNFRKPPDPVRPDACFEYVYERDRDGKNKRVRQVKASVS